MEFILGGYVSLVQLFLLTDTQQSGVYVLSFGSLGVVFSCSLGVLLRRSHPAGAPALREQIEWSAQPAQRAIVTARPVRAVLGSWEPGPLGSGLKPLLNWNPI